MWRIWIVDLLISLLVILRASLKTTLPTENYNKYSPILTLREKDLRINKNLRGQFYLMKDIVRSQVPFYKEPAGLSRSDGKRPDGVSLIPWSRGRCVTWDVTSPDTLAPSHLPSSATQAVLAAAARTEAAKTLKYSALAITHTSLCHSGVWDTGSLGGWGCGVCRPSWEAR